MEKKEEIVVKIMSSLDWHIIKRVKEIRKQRGMSQLTLSIYMRLSESVIGKIESPAERAKYNIRHLNSLAKGLNCSPKDLLPEKPIPYDAVKLSFRVKRSMSGGKKKRQYELIKEEPMNWTG